MYFVEKYCPVTCMVADGTHVPIPTLPLMTVRADVETSDVPIPTVPPPSTRKVPCTSNACPGVTEPIPTLPVFAGRTIKPPPKGLNVPIPTLPLAIMPPAGAVEVA